MSISSIAPTPNYFNTTPPARTPPSASAPALGTNSTIANKAAPQATDDMSLAERFGSDGTGIHTEIKVNGKTIGVVFNSGSLSIDNQYSAITRSVDWGSDDEAGLDGPDLVAVRTAKLLGALKEAGLGSNPNVSNALKLELQDARLEGVVASTAMSQSEWKQWLASDEREPGQNLDRSA